MIDFISIALITVFLIVMMLFKSKRNDSLLDIESTQAMRGFWSIIVVLVHVPLIYQNKYQDMIGSFAYIGVTYFFLISAFGMHQSYLKKRNNFFDNFWFKRLTKLLVPWILVYLLTILVKLSFNLNIAVEDFISLNKWVLQLIIFDFFYWIIFKLFKFKDFYKILIVVSMVFIWAVIEYFYHDYIHLAWSTESFGFIYGLVLSYNFDKIRKILEHKRIIIIITGIILSMVFGLTYIKFKDIYFIGGFVLKVILGFCLTSVVITLNDFLKFNNKVNQFMGKISYETYLVHGTIFIFFTNIFAKLNVNLASGLYILISLVSTILIAFLINVLSNYIVKKILKK